KMRDEFGRAINSSSKGTALGDQPDCPETRAEAARTGRCDSRWCGDDSDGRSAFNGTRWFERSTTGARDHHAFRKIAAQGAYIHGSARREHACFSKRNTADGSGASRFEKYYERDD